MSIPVHRTASASQRSSRAVDGAGNAWDMSWADSFREGYVWREVIGWSSKPESSSGSVQYYTETVSV
jgi:hypothetical protein